MAAEKFFWTFAGNDTQVTFHQHKTTDSQQGDLFQLRLIGGPSIVGASKKPMTREYVEKTAGEKFAGRRIQFA